MTGMRPVPLDFAAELGAELDAARALLASRTVDLARALRMDHPDKATWAQAFAYSAAVARVAEEHYGMPLEPDKDGKWRPVD